METLIVYWGYNGFVREREALCPVLDREEQRLALLQDIQL